MEERLNENDLKLLAFCRDTEKTTRQVAEYLGIASKNVSVRLNKLEEMKLIVVRKTGMGKENLIRTKEGMKYTSALITYLKAIKKKDGISYEELTKVLPLDISEPKNHDNWKVLSTLSYINPKLVTKKIVYSITPEGEKFLKENEK